MNKLASTQLLTQIVGLSGIAVLVGLWWCCLMQPLNQAGREIAQQRIETQALRSQQPILLASLESVRTSAANWQERETRVRLRTKPAKDDIDFLDWAHAQATRVDLQIRDFRTAGKEALGEYEGRGLMISAQGSFNSIFQFLEQLRDCPRMNRITSIEITPVGDNRTMFNISLRVVLFTLQAKET